MEDRHLEMIAKTATNVEWLVGAHKENMKEREAHEKRISSLEKSRARAKGAGAVGGVLATLSAILYKLIGGA